MTVDLSKIKPGDEVLVRLRVLRYGPSDYRGLSYVVCEDGYGEHFSDPSDVVVLADRIASHTPKALEVGDRVKHATGGDIVSIVHIDGDHAWVRAPGRVDSPGTVWQLYDMERVDA